MVVDQSQAAIFFELNDIIINVSVFIRVNSETKCVILVRT